jgi:hypothetical protein
VFVELAYDRFCMPRPIAVFGTMAKRFVDRTLEVKLHAASKVATTSTFSKVATARPRDPDAKAKKAAAHTRKVATVPATTTRASAGAKPSDTPKPPTKKLWRDPPRRFLFMTSSYMRHRMRREW